MQRQISWIDHHYTRGSSRLMLTCHEVKCVFKVLVHNFWIRDLVKFTTRMFTYSFYMVWQCSQSGSKGRFQRLDDLQSQGKVSEVQTDRFPVSGSILFELVCGCSSERVPGLSGFFWKLGYTVRERKKIVEVQHFQVIGLFFWKLWVSRWSYEFFYNMPCLGIRWCCFCDPNQGRFRGENPVQVRESCNILF